MFSICFYLPNRQNSTAKAGIFSDTKQGITIFAIMSATDEKSTFSSIAITQIIKMINTQTIIAAVKYVKDAGLDAFLPIFVALITPKISTCAHAIARITNG